MDKRSEKLAKKKEKLKKIIANREKSKTPAENTKSKFSCTKILEKAENLMDSFDFELALKFCNRALELEPNNVEALELQGAIHLQLMMFDKAYESYSQAIELSPDEGSSKYMCMGQLTCGMESVHHYLKGAELMKSELIKKKSPITTSDLSNAYLSIAEIYLTDECFEEKAADLCKENLDQALKFDPLNPEAHHLYASYHISVGDKESATTMITKGVDLWLPKLKEVDREGASELTNNICPISYSARINCSKILIELEKYDLASEILEYLLDEDDQVVEVWYLLGWINHLKGKGYAVNLKVYMEKGLELAKKIKFEDEEMLNHMKELLDGVQDDDDDDAEDDNMEVEDNDADCDGSDDDDDYDKADDDEMK